MSDPIAQPTRPGEFWRDHIRQIYKGVRQAQATKLLPLKALLAARDFEKVEGSLISPHNIDHPENDSKAYLEKRLNYVFMLNQLQPKKVLEIGFNWGYSSSLIMESWAPCSLRGIDIAHHWYTVPAGEVIGQLSRGRFSAVWSDSHSALREEKLAGNRYDMVIVDGGHAYEVARLDIVLSLELLAPGGVLIVDDTDAPSVRAAVLATVSQDSGMLELTPENIGNFGFANTSIPCYEQRYYLSRFTP